MKNPIGIGLAIAASATFALAHGEGDENKGNSSVVDNAFKQGTTVSYKPGAGVTFDGGEEFSLNLSGRIQIQWNYVDFDSSVPTSNPPPATGNESDINSFDGRRARLDLKGHVWSEDITYRLQTEMLYQLSALDAYIGWRFLNDDANSINLRLGLQKMRTGLQNDTDSAYMALPERSAASGTFGNLRATGALIEGQAFKTDNGGQLQYHVGAYNNDIAGGSNPGINYPVGFAGNIGPNESVALNYVIGAMWAMGGGDTSEHWTESDLSHDGETTLNLGLNVHFGNDRTAGVKDESNMINAFAGWKSGSGIAIQGEFYTRNDDFQGGGDSDTSGWYVQGGYTTAPDSGDRKSVV